MGLPVPPFTTEFPQYRKYTNNKSYFKIHSRTVFDELRAEPDGRFKLHHFEAKILPDRNFVTDMLFDYEDYWEAIGEQEFLTVMKNAEG